MKRSIAFILALVMCLSLSACGASAPSQETKPTQTVTPTLAQDDTPIVQATEPKEADQTAAHIKIMTGTWLLAHFMESIPSQIVLREDKTCTLDGEEYTWEFSYTNGSRFGVNVTAGTTVKYELDFSDYNNREWAILIYDGNDRGVYINPQHYDVVEITPENWQEYFEIRYDLYWEEDAFGKVTRLRGCNYFFALKDEYLPRLSTVVTGDDLLTKNAVELSFTHGWQKCDVNLEKKTCTPIDGEFTVNGTDTDMDNLYHRYDSDYSMNISGFSSGMKEDSIPWLTDVKVLRADCPLYLIKDEFKPTE